MNLLNFKKKTDENACKRLEEKIQFSLSTNDMPLIAMTMLSIAQNNIDGRINVKETSDLFSKLLPFSSGAKDQKIREIVEIGSCLTTNQDPDENVRRIRDMIKTL